MKGLAYRNQGRGQPHTDGSGREAVPVRLEELVVGGNRAQRRWAKQQLKKINAAGSPGAVVKAGA